MFALKMNPYAPKKTILSMVIFLILLTLVACYSPIILNRTKSLPNIVWVKTGPIRGDVRNKYVLFCSGNNRILNLHSSKLLIGPGSCAGRTASLMKQIVAVPGDVVEVSDLVKVNGLVVANSHIDKTLAEKLQTARGIFIVQENTFWMMSTYTDQSFDSRYFGAIEAKEVVSLIEPFSTH
ncbi:MAG: conjugative transfer signal peptidase TraF [Proteobacteria bacterium]|nr:MAG: conjugative transfer signal peptidase TraF [Pseudomonadota bacterium]